MTVERTFHCDGPDCESHVRTMSEYPVGGFVVVRERGLDAVWEERHFCSWDCVLRFGARIEPVARFDFGEGRMTVLLIIVGSLGILVGMLLALLLIRVEKNK